MLEEIRNKIVDCVVENFSVDREEIFIDESLIDQGIIDSIGLYDIITFLETNFSIKVEEDHMVRENFGSIIKIADFVLKESNKLSTSRTVA